MQDDALGHAAPYRWWVLANVVLINVLVTGVAWNYVIMIVPDVMADLEGGLGWGTLWAGIALGIMAFSVPAGAIGDRLGVRSAVGGGVLLAGASLLLRAQAADSALMGVSMVGFGLALALVLSNFPKALGEWFGEAELGLANGLAQAGVGIGIALAVFGTARVVESAGGWRSLTQLLGLGALAAAALWLLTVRPRAASQSGRAADFGALLSSIRRVAGLRDVRLLALCYLLYLAGYLGFIGYVPTYLTEVRKLGADAITLGPLAFIAGSLALPWLSDRVGRRRGIYLAGMLAGGLALFGVVWAGGASLWLVFVLLGLGTGVIGLLFVIPVELPDVGPELAGSAIGFATTAGFLGGTLSALLLTPLAAASPAAGFGLWGACLVTSALLILRVRETGSRG